MIKVKKVNNKKNWEKFVLNHSQGSFLQSWNWGEFNKKLGHKVFYLGFFKKRELEAACLLIVKKAKRGRYLECPAGPLINWDNISFFKVFINQLKKIGAMEKCQFCRVRPQLKNNEKNRFLFKKHSFIKAPMHLHAQTTWQIDLLKKEDDLLKEMRKTTRYLIRKADRLSVKVERSNKTKDVDLLYKLQIETASRHNFVPFSKKYFKAEFESFSRDNQIRIYKAIWKKKILAISFIIFYGKEAVYHYSASSTKYSKIPASYALQWQVIKDAKKAGIRTYNMWGIAETDNPKHRFRGVTLFKKGFGGYQVDWLKAHDLVFQLGYWPLFIFESIRKLYRRL